jgi:hypothetical protein
LLNNKKGQGKGQENEQKKGKYDIGDFRTKERKLKHVPIHYKYCSQKIANIENSDDCQPAKQRAQTARRAALSAHAESH